MNGLFIGQDRVQCHAYGSLRRSNATDNAFAEGRPVCFATGSGWDIVKQIFGGCFNSITCRGGSSIFENTGIFQCLAKGKKKLTPTCYGFPKPPRTVRY